MLSIFVQNLDTKRLDISVCWFEVEERLSSFPYLSVEMEWLKVDGDDVLESGVHISFFIQYWTTKDDDTPTEELRKGWNSQVLFIFRFIGGNFAAGNQLSCEKGQWCHHLWDRGLVDITVTPPSFHEDVSINLKLSSQASQYFITDQGFSLGKFLMSFF